MAIVAISAGAAVASAIAGVVSSGVSVANASLSSIESLPCHKACGIEVENWTKFLLDEAQMYANGGDIPNPPCVVMPAKREAMVAVNMASGGGTFGTVSWRVSGLKCRVVVMWAVPHEEDLPNWFAVGLTTRAALEHNNEWYQQIYEGHAATDLKYNKREYGKQIRSVSIENDDMQVVGTMGSAKKCEASVIIIPKTQKNYPESILRVLDMK